MDNTEVEYLWSKLEELKLQNRHDLGFCFSKLQSQYSDTKGDVVSVLGYNDFEGALRERGYDPEAVCKYINDYEEHNLSDELLKAEQACKRAARIRNKQRSGGVRARRTAASCLPLPMQQVAATLPVDDSVEGQERLHRLEDPRSE